MKIDRRGHGEGLNVWHILSELSYQRLTRGSGFRGGWGWLRCGTPVLARIQSRVELWSDYSIKKWQSDNMLLDTKDTESWGTKNWPQIKLKFPSWAELNLMLINLLCICIADWGQIKNVVSPGEQPRVMPQSDSREILVKMGPSPRMCLCIQWSYDNLHSRRLNYEQESCKNNGEHQVWPRLKKLMSFRMRSLQPKCQSVKVRMIFVVRV